MSTTIEHLDEFETIIITLDGGVADSLKRVATRAALMTFNKLLRRNAQANSSDFWARLVDGASHLKGWAIGSECRLLINGTSAFHAHLMLCLMASQPNLNWREAMDLDIVLGGLEEVIPVILTSQRLPSLSELLGSGPKNSSTQGSALQVYEMMFNKPPHVSASWKIRLSDALRLRDLLGMRPNPATQALWIDLSKVTRSHRDAVRNLAEVQLAHCSPSKC